MFYIPIFFIFDSKPQLLLLLAKATLRFIFYIKPLLLLTKGLLKKKTTYAVREFSVSCLNISLRTIKKNTSNIDLDKISSVLRTSLLMSLSTTAAIIMTFIATPFNLSDFLIKNTLTDLCKITNLCFAANSGCKLSKQFMWSFFYTFKFCSLDQNFSSFLAAPYFIDLAA